MNMSYLKNPVTLIAIILLLAFMQQSLVYADNEQQCRIDIQRLLNNYQQALNDSDTKRVLPLYTDDGVFMPSNKPTAVGKAQIRRAYQFVFKELDLNVKFHIDEIEQHNDMAFVRTTSDGEIKLLEKNITIKNNSRELFILKRIDNKWKIYRYMFNETS